MDIINVIDLFKINQSILKYIDKDIINHSEESAYIAYKIASKLGYSKENIEKLVLGTMLHDIGAYKVDEIDNIKKFEIIDPGKHSIYGYCILNHSRVFKHISEYVLYHHHEYKLKDKYIKEIPIPNESFIIGLADRVSILCESLNYDKSKIKKRIENISDEVFNPKYIDVLQSLVKDEGLIEEITSGYYKDIINEKIQSINMNIDDIKNYLVFLPLSINFFSFETSIHTVGVASATKKICEKLEIEEQYKEKIKIASYLHDIGKVCIPKHILEKEGKLTEEEYSIMKKHVWYSQNILEDAKVDKELITLACNHHERLDGSGYSRGLSSNDLTIGDRIISVGDIFCALTEPRIYKESFSKEKVLKILYEMVNNNYLDNRVVKVVYENYEEILNYTKSNRDSYKERLNLMIKEYKYITYEMDNIYKYEAIS